MPTLYLMVGYPGAGKTTVSNYISDLTGAVHIWADHERREMFNQPTHSAQESKDLYKHLNKRAGELLAKGNNVIFDTNFNYRNDRQALRHVADQHNAATVVVWLTTPRELAYHRATRDSHGKPTRVYGNMSHETFERIANHLQPPHDDEHPIVIDGSQITQNDVKQKLGL